MTTVIASEAMNRTGMKNRLGLRRSERRSRVMSGVFDAAAGIAKTDDLSSAGVVMRQPAPAGRAHARSATAWLHRLRTLASRRPRAHRTGRSPDRKQVRSREVPM